MKTQILFHSGLDTIGAVILEIRYGNDRVFLEAGTAYNPSFDMFDSNVDKRNNFIYDYLYVNEIPAIDGIYDQKYILNTNLLPANKTKYNQAFFITHLHLDHMRMMGMISNDVKVYLSKAAQTIEFALEDINQGIETIRNNYEDIPDEVAIGKIKVKKFVLNPQSYQDFSFLITTPDLKIHYTGDIFAYGIYRNNLLKEIEYVKNQNVDLLVCEGTQFWPNMEVKNYNFKHQLEENEKMLTKEQFDYYNIKTLKEFDGLIILNYYEREISDVIDYLDFASKSDRILVFEPESAYIINKFLGIIVNVMVPDTYKNIPNYLNDVIKNNNIITKDKVIANPKKYIVQNTYPNLLELLDYRNINCLYLHHSGTPIGAFDSKYSNLINILNLANIKYKNAKEFDGKVFHPHAMPQQILAYIDMINPKLVIPSHSANRDCFIANLNFPSFKCKLNEIYEFDENNKKLKSV